MATPQTFTMASRPATYPSLWSRPPHQLWGRILLTDPCPPGLGPVCRLRGFATGSLSLHLLVSIAGPRPSGSPSLSRRCQGCSRPPRRLPDQASLIFTSLLRQAHSGVLSSPPGHMAPRGARRYRNKTSSSSERCAVWLCSEPSARHAALTSVDGAADLLPLVPRVRLSSSPGLGSRPYLPRNSCAARSTSWPRLDQCSDSSFETPSMAK
jgi:hypothetical protein